MIMPLIAKYRSQLEAAGLLKKAAAPDLSPRIAALRPSLGKVSAALTERPDRFSIVQPSPLSILFDVTLPRLEPLLVELGEERTEGMIAALCQYSLTIIEKRGLPFADQYLAELYQALPRLEAKLREPDGVGKIIDAYDFLEFFGSSEDYLRLWLDDKVESLTKDAHGLLVLSLQSTASDADLRFLSKAKNIGLLRLTGTMVTDAGLACLSALPVLAELILQETRITNTGLDEIVKIAWLRALDLGHTEVTNDGLARLSELPRLETLFLSGDKITDEGMAHLLALPRLQRLSLGNQISDAGLAYVSQIKTISTLDLNNSGITNAGLAHLSSLPALKTLNLEGTAITDDALEHIFKLVNLKQIYLRGTRLSADLGFSRLQEKMPDLMIFPTVWGD